MHICYDKYVRLRRGENIMKKILICICMVLLLVTSCGKVPQLKDGKEAVITSKNGDISVDDLYEEMKNIRKY